MSYHFINSATVRSYECRGKETWYQLQVIPVNEPVYRIYRRYEDFLQLDVQLESAYYTATKATIARSETMPNDDTIYCYHDPCNKNNMNKNSNNSRRRVPSYTNRLCEKNCASSSTSSLTTTAAASNIERLAISTSKEPPTLPSLRSQHPTQEIYWIANKRAKRKWQQQHIERYLLRLFIMPLKVSQSPIVLRFLNYQPYRYYHITKSLPPTLPTLRQGRRQIMQHKRDNDSDVHSSSSNSNSPHSGKVTSTTQTTLAAAAAAPLTRRKLLLRRKDKKNINILNKKYNKVDVEEEDNEIEDNKTMVVSSSSIDVKSNSTTLVAPRSISHSWNDDTIEIFLFLSPRVFITVQIRRRSTLEELRDALNRELGQSRLDPLPTPSVLAYHHVGRSDRQGAMYTLTLNCSEPWMDQETLMTLASARYLTFFSKASNFLPPASSPPPVSLSSSPTLNENDIADNRSTNDQQTSSQKSHSIQQGIILLIASDSDLEAAMNGKWRRLDHVTLTCLAW